MFLKSGGDGDGGDEDGSDNDGDDDDCDSPSLIALRILCVTVNQVVRTYHKLVGPIFWCPE